MKKLENTSPDANSWQFLSGTNIKIAGIVLMTLDHLHQMFIVQGAPAWLNWFGRPVATMFLFLCAEGFFYTRSRKRYLLQFLGGFLFMAVMNHLLSLTMPMPDIALINNIFGTLFMAVYYMWTIDRIRGGFREKSPVRIITGIAGFLLPFLLSLIVILALRTRNWNITRIFLFIPTPLSVEGGLVLILIGVAFYLLRKYRLAQAALLAVISALTWYFSRDTPGDVQWLMVFAIIPMILYNGKRGSGGKYFFYIFYPAHIYLLYCAAWFLRSEFPKMADTPY
jgi:hypothetical protein